MNEVPDYKLWGELAQWREAYTIADARVQNSGVYTVAELAVDSCLSALSSWRCGFRHIFTTETEQHKMEVAELLTRAPCIFAHDFKQLRARYGHCSYLKSGQPCVDYMYSSPGPQTGRWKE